MKTATKIILIINVFCSLWFGLMYFSHKNPDAFQHPIIGVVWEMFTLPAIFYAFASPVYSVVNTIKNKPDYFQYILWIVNFINVFFCLLHNNCTGIRKIPND